MNPRSRADHNRVRSLRILAPLVAATMLAPSAHAASYSDPAGDKCKDYTFATFCGEDYSAAADSVDAAGNIHLSVSGNGANCVGNGLDQHNNPRFGIQTAGATTPANATLVGEIASDFGTTNFFFRTALGVKTSLTSNVTTVGGVQTYDVSIPPNLIGSSFAWIVGNGCIGEQPWEASDIVPNTGLFAVSTAVTPPPPAPPAPAPAPDADGDGVSDASDACPATAGPSASSGCPVNAFSIAGKPVPKNGFTTLSLKVPGAGVVKAAQAAVTRKRPALVKATRVRATKAGKVTVKLKPNKPGKKVLAAKGTFSVKVTFTFTPTGGKPAKVVGRIKLIR